MSQDNQHGKIQLSMVQYSEPTLVTEHSIEDRTASSDEMEMKFPKPKSATLDANREFEDLLNDILPPRYWQENGKMWQQTVSPSPAVRDDVVRLQELLDTRLALTQARESGLCMVRHGIYAECFDEIIRQATINCSERGLLLLRMRDEMRMTLDACEVLYGNAVQFGMRKASQAAKEKEELTERVKDLEVANVTIVKVMEDTKQSFEQTARRTSELYEAEEKRFTEELVFMKKANAQLKSQLEAITAPRK